MRTGIKVAVSAKDRRQLDAIVADRNSPQKHVWRAQIVLLTADGCGTAEIMRHTGVSKTAVWRWQERFMTDRVAGMLRDKTRPSRIPPLEPEVAARVVAATQADPPGETTHWTATATAPTIRASVSVRCNASVSSMVTAAPDASVQAVQRSTVRYQAQRHRRASTWILQRVSFSRSTRKARYRRSIAPSQACQ